MTHSVLGICIYHFSRRGTWNDKGPALVKRIGWFETLCHVGHTHACAKSDDNSVYCNWDQFQRVPAADDCCSCNRSCAQAKDTRILRIEVPRVSLAV